MATALRLKAIDWITLTILAITVRATAADVAPADMAPSGAIEAIDRIAREPVDQKKTASLAVAVVKNGRLVLARGYGMADLENSVPATAESVYRLGSITKQFTAMAIMLLAEQGKLEVEDDLSKFLPDFPLAGHKVSVHQLLNHTSGIKSYTSTKDFFKRARQDMTHDELLALFKDEPFEFEPGAKWRYNNSGYYLLGMIIEKASGQTYAEYLQQHIFQPLAMSATRYGHLRTIIPRRAAGYRRQGEELVNDDPISMDAPGAAGALVSNVLDLVKWHQALEAGELVSSASYEAMYRRTKLADDSDQPYGYGWALNDLAGKRKLGHGGGINGFSTMIGRYPDERLAVIVLSNTAGFNTGAVEVQIAKVMLGIQDSPIADLPLDAPLVEQLAGVYLLEELKVEFTVEDGKLFAMPEGRPKDRLKYQGQRRFVSSANPDIRIRFMPDEGQATAFDLEAEGQKMSAKRAE